MQVAQATELVPLRLALAGAAAFAQFINFVILIALFGSAARTRATWIKNVRLGRVEQMAVESWIPHLRSAITQR